MDPGLIDHMLPEIVDSNVHQFTGVQGAPAQMGRLGGMGADPVKGVINPVVCQGLIKDPGFIMRMPGKGGVHIFKKAFFDHGGFSGGIFLCRAAKVKDRAREFFLFHDIFQKQGSGQNAASQKIVTAAMAPGSIQRRGRGDICRLGHSRQSVVFTQKADHRFAAAPLCHKGCRKRRGGNRNGKALFLQNGFQKSAGAVFLKSRFCVFPQGIGGSSYKIPVFFNKRIIINI